MVFTVRRAVESLAKLSETKSPRKFLDEAPDFMLWVHADEEIQVRQAVKWLQEMSRLWEAMADDVKARLAAKRQANKQNASEAASVL